MKLSEINDEWEKDSKIDPLDIANESLHGPSLHSKYLRLLTSAKMQLRKAQDAYLLLKRDKIRYYRGEMTKDELRQRGWDQFLRKVIKAEVESLVTTDHDVLQSGDKVEYLQTQVLALESILKSIMSRSYEIKNYQEWMKFTSGG